MTTAYDLHIEITDHRYPLTRIVREISDRVEADVWHGPIIINGQTIGRFEIKS